MREHDAMTLAALFFGGAGIAGLGSWAVGRLAIPLGLVDVPNVRSSHAAPTPKSGGVGIALAFAVAAALLGLGAGFWGPVLGMALLGFCDDRLDLSARLRLAVQLVLAAVAAVVLLEPAGMFWAVVPLAVLYVAGTANFYNFMDGINGIAGLTGVVAFGLLSVFAWRVAGDGTMALLMLCLVGACLGFLPFNFPRARVFMGDVGSLLLGTGFAGSVLVLASTPGEFVVLNGFMAPFYADALSTLYRRWRRGERLMQAHRQHLYQVLANELGQPHWRVTLLYGGGQLLCGLGLLALHGRAAAAPILFLALAVASFMTVSVKVRKAASTRSAR